MKLDRFSFSSKYGYRNREYKDNKLYLLQQDRGILIEYIVVKSYHIDSDL